MFLERRIIIGINAIKVATIAINAVTKDELRMTKLTIKAEIANAIPTP